MSAPPLERSYCGEQRMRRDPAVRDGMLSHRCDSVLRETTGALAGPADLSWRKRRQSDKIGSADDLQYPLAKRARVCSNRCAPRRVHCICCFLTNRLLTTWLIVSAQAALSPARSVHRPRQDNRVVTHGVIMEGVRGRDRLLERLRSHQPSITMHIP
jgi:hypothetical protein